MRTKIQTDPLPSLAYKMHPNNSFERKIIREEKDHIVIQFPAENPIFPSQTMILGEIQIRVNRGSFNGLNSSLIKQKLYYSGGIVEKDLNLISRLNSGSNELVESSFTQ